MREFYLICYDISDEKRLSKIAKVMEGFGVRVLYSVFECWISSKDFERMKLKVEKLMDPEEDKVRYYKLCANCREFVEHIGYGKDKRAVTEEEVVI